MTTNQSPEYLSAQKKYLNAKNDEERLLALEEMISHAPAHKGGEAMRANLRARYKRISEDLEKKKKNKKGSGKAGIKKQEMQAVLIGLTGAGKSSVLASLTNTFPHISSLPYTTKVPMLGTLDYSYVKIQIVDMPAINFESFDQGISNTADTLIIVIENPNQLPEIFKHLKRTMARTIIVLNKIDLLSESERRKFYSQLQSKKYNFVLYSAKTKENIQELKDKIWESFDKMRIYTKQPGHPPDKDPVVLEKESTVAQVAEKILHGMSKKIKGARVTGPSSKFPNQQVSLSHMLKDKDVVEFSIK